MSWNEEWVLAWPKALEAWSAYTLLREPLMCRGSVIADNDMQGQIAATRFTDQRVMINCEEIEKLGLQAQALAVLAHEVGHHVYAPGNMADQGRCLAAMTRMLAGVAPAQVHMCANLYQDLLINDRLQRRVQIDESAVYKLLRIAAEGHDSGMLWQVYTRTYEHLWRLPPLTLCTAGLPDDAEADSLLLSRLIRHFAGRWLAGARRFAAIVYRYLAEDAEKFPADASMHGKGHRHVKDGEVPDGLCEISDEEEGDDESFDAALGDRLPKKKAAAGTGGQYREPFAYGELIKSLGIALPEDEVIARYYRERALPHLLPFPERRRSRGTEPLPEGYATWQVGDSVESIDIFGSLTQSPVMIPGVTTVQREYGEVPGTEPGRTPVNLDIYIDCSGSMPNPAGSTSYLALAATILSLSALRVGAAVQATLWSSPNVFKTSNGFIRDEKEILKLCTGFVSGSTAFPLHVLRDTYASRTAADAPVHIVVISDDGADTMLAKDERGSDGANICIEALRKARAGGTLVLNIPSPEWPARKALEKIGFKVHAVSDWSALQNFARAFVRDTYGAV